MAKDKDITIVINGRSKVVIDKKITFEEIIILAFGEFIQDKDTAYTIIYSNNNNKDGALVYNDILRIHEGVIFNVTRTNKS